MHLFFRVFHARQSLNELAKPRALSYTIPIICIHMPFSSLLKAIAHMNAAFCKSWPTLPIQKEMFRNIGLTAALAFIHQCCSLAPPIVVSPGLDYKNPSHSPVNCTDLETGIATNCYAELDETSYLINWNTTIRKETCSPSQLWSNCYLNSAYTNGTERTITKQNISQHDCSTLNGNSSSNGCPPPFTDNKDWTPQEYYAVLNIYTVQHHIFVWSQAISARESQVAIAQSMKPNGMDDTSLLQTLIQRYGINHAADEALSELLNGPNIRPQPLAKQGGGIGVRPGMDSGEWAPLLRRRLQDALQLVMKDFDHFLDMVKGGAYSTYNLALSGQLENALKDS